MAREVHGGRSLLNLPGHHSTAAIVAEIDNTEDREVRADDDGYMISPTIVCKITDCSESVNIEFDVSTANQLENSLFKVDTIVEALMAMRDGLVIEHHRLQDRIDSHPDTSRLYNLRNAVGKRSEITP